MEEEGPSKVQLKGPLRIWEDERGHIKTRKAFWFSCSQWSMFALYFLSRGLLQARNDQIGHFLSWDSEGHVPWQGWAWGLGFWPNRPHELQPIQGTSAEHQWKCAGSCRWKCGDKASPLRTHVLSDSTLHPSALFVFTNIAVKSHDLKWNNQSNVAGVCLDGIFTWLHHDLWRSS